MPDSFLTAIDFKTCEAEPFQPPVLVTGAGGFVGGYVVRELLSSGTPVRALVRTERVGLPLRAIGATTFVGDIRDPKAVEAACAGTQGVIHLAALFRSAGFPDKEYYDINVEGTRNIFEAAIKNGISRVVHCSTVGVHGHITSPPASEQSPFAPGDVYQSSKLAGENLAMEYYRRGDVSGLVIRPAMIFGPGDMRTLKLFRMVEQGTFFYIGDGSAYVHFVDVRDLARAFKLAFFHNRLNAEAFIISGAEALPLKDFVSKISRLLKVPEPRIRLPLKPMEALGAICETLCIPFGIEPPIYRRRIHFFTNCRHFDSSKAAQMLNYSPRQGLDSELRDIIAWYKRHGFLAKGAVEARSGDLRPAAPLDFSSVNERIMVRALDGRILYWNKGAEVGYGFTPPQAEGRVSHELLKTEFPEPLERINQRVLESSTWSGKLVHRARAGGHQQVSSNWYLGCDRQTKEPLVVEVNLAA